MEWLKVLLISLGGLGGLAALLRLGAAYAYKMHHDALASLERAIEAERGRADDARARAEAAEKRADLREAQIAEAFKRARE